MRVITDHNCSRRHRTARAFASCVWPNAADVHGVGQIAVVSTCDDPVVALFERLRPARLHLQELAVFGCRPGCQREHELVGLDFDGPAPDLKAAA